MPSNTSFVANAFCLTKILSSGLLIFRIRVDDHCTGQFLARANASSKRLATSLTILFGWQWSLAQNWFNASKLTDVEIVGISCNGISHWLPLLCFSGEGLGWSRGSITQIHWIPSILTTDSSDSGKSVILAFTPLYVNGDRTVNCPWKLNDLRNLSLSHFSVDILVGLLRKLQGNAGLLYVRLQFRQLNEPRWFCRSELGYSRDHFSQLRGMWCRWPLTTCVRFAYRTQNLLNDEHRFDSPRTKFRPL